MLKKVALYAILALILLALPLVARRLYYHEGVYRPGEVPRPDLSTIKAQAPELPSFRDRFIAAEPGTILVDQAHDNRFTLAELNLLQARLTARGQRLEAVQEADELAAQLRYARALVVISPGQDWTPDEIGQVQEFVDKGGRLLLVTDPTRFSVEYDESDTPILDYDAPHINDLAARFGLVFQSDYLYNTAVNEGNFRNILLTDFVPHELTQGLSQVVFYATHSIISEERALITAGGETRSSSSERADTLAVAVLAGDGAVLALGDLTFMTEPYNTIYDNDRLIANVADFLSGAQRRYELADFPLFFADQVNLVYSGDPLLDSDLLPGSSDLQTLFADVGKTLLVRAQEDRSHDTLFLGLYQEAGEVEPYLTAAEVTLLITPTQAAEEKEQAQATLTPTLRLTVTPSPPITTPLTTTPEPTPTLAFTATPMATPEIIATAEVSPAARNRIEIGSLGQMVPTGTALLLLQTAGERHVLVILADTQTGLLSTIRRLTDGDLQDCLLQETETPTATVVALCPTGEVAAGEGQGGWAEPEAQPAPPDIPAQPPALTTAPPPTGTVEVTPPPPTPTPVGKPQGHILVIALDKGKGRYDNLTDAGDYADILGSGYKVTVWSEAEKGVPATRDLLSYDLVIWAAGDYEDPLDEEENQALFTILLSEVPVIVSGAFVSDSPTRSVQRDIQVNDANHPLAKGFKAGEVIPFVPAPSGQEYETNVVKDKERPGIAIPFVRGPDSQDAGTAAISAVADEMSKMRLVLIGFPIYLLPEEAKTRLVLNAAAWLISSE